MNTGAGSWKRPGSGRASCGRRNPPGKLAEQVGGGLQIEATRKQLLLEQRSLGDLVKLELEVLRAQIPKLLKVRAARERQQSN